MRRILTVAICALTLAGCGSSAPPRKTEAQIDACWKQHITTKAHQLTSGTTPGISPNTSSNASINSTINAAEYPVEVNGLTIDADNYAAHRPDTTGLGIPNMTGWLKATQTDCGQIGTGSSKA